MKKLFGFTLAEVLITLGIIGVVAAITTPTLVTNVKNRSYATALKSTVGDLENAFAMAMSVERIGRLHDASFMSNAPVDFNSSAEVKNTFINNLRQYIKIANVETMNSSQYYTQKNTALHQMNNSGGMGDITTINNHIPITLKNGSVMFIETRNDGHPELAAFVWIDVNGPAAPNTIARDVFLFDLASDGTLAPEGGARAHEVSGASLYQNLCLVQPNASALCTARLVENGYEFDY